MNQNAYENFEAALKRLREFTSEKVENDRDKAGIIQAFEFTYEQAWKSIQKIAGRQGLSIQSPKQAFSWALAQKWIPFEDESHWLQMIKDRNSTSHGYRQDVADEVFKRIQNHYLQRFENLLEELKK